MEIGVFPLRLSIPFRTSTIQRPRASSLQLSALNHHCNSHLNADYNADDSVDRTLDQTVDRKADSSSSHVHRHRSAEDPHSPEGV